MKVCLANPTAGRMSTVYTNDEDFETLLLVLLAMEVILVHFDENLKIWGDFGPAGHFLGVYLVESIDKGSIFRLHYSTNR